MRGIHIRGPSFFPCASRDSLSFPFWVYAPVWSPADTQHWIPGAKDRRGASQPSPRDGAVEVATDADFIFLGGFRATSHTVLIADGLTGDDIAKGASGTIASLHIHTYTHTHIHTYIHAPFAGKDIAERGAGGPGTFAPIANLTGEDNVAHPRLKARSTYSWRADAHLADGTTLKGPVWTFTTGDSVSCPVTHYPVFASRVSVDRK